MTHNKAVWTVEGTVIKISGRLDGESVDEIVSSMHPDNIYTLDIKDVEDINFAGLRSLLRCRKSGQKFSVLNACSSVAEKFEDTGVSVFVDVSRRPKPLNLGQYEEFGAGYLSKAYNSEDGDSVIKVYGSKVPKRIVCQEKFIARSVMIFGIPTPLVGSLYEDGDLTGLDFERIEGKRSLSRIISEEPHRLEEISRLFARMCKHLHATPCDTDTFPDRTFFYRNNVMRNQELSGEEKNKVLSFLDSVPSENTCLHGDMQPSNVITNGKDTLWIDLADFGYGNHMLDMGMLYFLCNLNPEVLTQHIFHMSTAQTAQFWDFFVEEYFGATQPQQKEDINAEVKNFAALHMLNIGTCYGFEPGMMEFIRAQLLGDNVK